MVGQLTLGLDFTYVPAVVKTEGLRFGSKSSQSSQEVLRTFTTFLELSQTLLFSVPCRKETEKLAIIYILKSCGQCLLIVTDVDETGRTCS